MIRSVRGRYHLMIDPLLDFSLRFPKEKVIIKKADDTEIKTESRIESERADAIS